MAFAIANVFASISGAVLIGMEFGWKAGVGAFLLAWFARTDKQQ